MPPADPSLTLVWAGIIAAAVAFYVILDGFDLGIGILFPFTADEAERDQMMNSVAPFWDGNETWLVLGGGGLLVVFPLAYAIIMPALYLPVIVMLLALIFRGVAFEYRWVSKPQHKAWDVSFALGSTVAAFAQGVILAGLVQGVRVENGQFAGGPFDWATPFAVLCGVSVVAGYALLGACWLIHKTDGRVQTDARRWARVSLVLVLVGVGAVSAATPLLIPRVWERWFSWPNIAYLAPIPLLTGLVAWRAWVSIHDLRHELAPFVYAVLLFLLGYLGLAISNLPYIVPPSVTLYDAAATPSTQFFVLVGVLVLLPVILGYTVFVYWMFRGKVRIGEGYH
jgi:cytochrome d ubiquinol oxidase subunit II